MSRKPADKSGAKGSVRCAIYTRKSSEEGLEQAFNSLDAQREACEAFVLSQAGEGWTALRQVYDDGGFSGGTMERPGLKRLLADIAAGMIDTVVVYKVDRLTRSLSDFARIVDHFDGAGVSFVSVTQAFNTTTSMGRLTLNVLLSFAQFEREVTGERIRDKIAASKAKGMWMGGVPPLGYGVPTDKATRRLVLVEEEAAVVRHVFDRYLALGSVSVLEKELDRSGVRSKAWVNSKGEAKGGLGFSRGALYHLLRNRLYLGEISNRTSTVIGAHPPVVDAAVFDAVQAQLKANAVVRKAGSPRVTTSPLKGKLFDEFGQPMNPVFSYGHKGRVYRYYVSAALQQGRGRTPEDHLRRVSAGPLEEMIVARVAALLGREQPSPWPSVIRVEVHAEELHIVVRAEDLSSGRQGAEAAIARAQKRLEAGDQLSIDGAQAARLVLPIRMRYRGGRVSMSPKQGCLPAPTNEAVTLSRALRTAHAIRRANGLTFEPIFDRFAAQAPKAKYDRRLIKLAYLAPDIQGMILAGSASLALNREQMIHRGLPILWSDQRRLLGV